MAISIEKYTEDAISRFSDAKYINENVVPVGSLVETEDYDPIVVMTRPFTRPHFGLGSFACCCLYKGEFHLLHIQYLFYVKSNTLPRFRLSTYPATFSKAIEITKPEKK